MSLRPQILSALLTVLTSLAISTPPISAQSNIIPDDTLGTESSQVIPNFIDGEPVEAIFGGAVREQNLFHSFEAFDVDAGRFAFFSVPDGVTNVLSRVTGSNPSNILGVLGTVGGTTPNLYLINPNGIIFGPDARLLVDGSFIATTAQGIQLGEDGFFSTVNPESSSLLTVDPSALLFGSRIGELSSQGNLQVDEGQSLIFSGGDIDLDEGLLFVAIGEGGNVELSAVAEAGIVELDRSDNGLLGLSVPNDLARADVDLNNTRLRAVSTGSGGDISVMGKNINVSGSQIQVGISENTGSAESATGEISLDASESIRIEPTSAIGNVVFEGAQGNGGDITIRAGSISSEGSLISASTLAEGNAGDITFQTGEVALDATNVFSIVGDDGIGSAGDVTLDVSNLSLTNGSQISASSFGQGIYWERNR